MNTGPGLKVPGRSAVDVGMDAYPAATAEDRAVEMIDLNGNRHMVAKITDKSGADEWCSRKFIKSRETFSGTWLQVSILGWTLASATS